MATARPDRAGTSRLSWRVAAVCLLVGLALSIVSVPVAAVAAQFGRAYGGQSEMVQSYYRAADGTAYAVLERYWFNQNRQGFRPTLMRHQQSQAVAQPGVYSVPGGGRMVTTPHFSAFDPRLPVLHRPPAAGFDIVEAYSAGWPMHAAHSIAHLQATPGAARREHGLLRFTILGKALVIPVLPIWTGLLGNTMLSGGTLLVAWWIFRGRRLAKRRARGECLACGYPLDGDMERCPECGAPNKHRLQTPTLAKRPPPSPPMPPILG